ncbi:hypothetical protein [Cellulomonas hominis]|uniref:hypothetical protein n=1 Tax=Cellulomonas hominis TaxID=156981 RepID=UPI00144415E2|nr:hypothetical protein [Cellulomonas hominis]NKY08955.1 hypothetical protein [Cellulomonas hominis]
MAEVPLRTSPGVVTTEAGARKVVLDDGTRLAPLWPATVVVDGDRVQVLLVDGTAHVIGPVVPAPRPISGTVAGAAAGGYVPVTTSTGTVQARYAGTAPASGTLVGLIWQGGAAPFLLPGTLAPIATDPQSTPDLPAPPPTGPDSGTLLVPAAGSGSWRTGGWGWASSSDVVQGGSPYVSQDSRGGWWYGSAPQALAGRTVTGLRIRLSSRLRIGSYNSAAALHLYRTTDTARPGGDFNRAAGPHDVALAAGANWQWVTLPAAWGQALVDGGGGIGVQGSPYAGLVGAGSDPESGQLAIDWTR